MDNFAEPPRDEEYEGYQDTGREEELRLILLGKFECCGARYKCGKYRDNYLNI